MTLPPLFPDLSVRLDACEQMDDLHSNRHRLENTLRQFGLTNRCFARSRGLLKRYVMGAMLGQPEREYHLVDVGAGACEIAVWLIQACRRRRLRLRVTACDHDPRVVEFARRHHGQTPELTILQRDARDLKDLRPVDFVFANHLLHHLSDEGIVALLRALALLKPAGILLNDIERRMGAYVGFYATTIVLRRGSFAWEDGLISVRKGFRVPELAEMVARADVSGSGYKIQRVFPARIVLTRGFQSS